ncbi:MAG: slipin family protein [Treponema sp.]|jgi:regulator of protease activity HflC (stomatin/prohibitin superfamily)|nr:slipin family protein [Treponema sp.]
MNLKKSNDTVLNGRASFDAIQPPAKFSRRQNRPDFSLFTLRLMVLAIAAVSLFGSAPAEELSFQWRLIIFFAVLMAVFSIRKAKEWERAVVLRFGKFHKVKGPGLFFLIPLVDQVYRTIDIRIRVADFYAQETLTGDSVTVRVDAFCFWLVWDPQKAALEVENYEEAVALASKAALRNAIAKNELGVFLARGDLIEKQIQEEVERQTTEWGITVQYVEITDIQIPANLQDSLSRMAQAEREKKARIFLAEAEIEIARKLEEAVRIYAANEPAMKLKILSILNEGLKAGNSMMLIPNSIAEELKTKDIFGLEALNEIRKGKEASK